MQYVFVADKNHSWYKRRLNFVNERKATMQKIYSICANYNIKEECVDISIGATLYLSAECEYSPEVIKMCKTNKLHTRNGVFYVVKKNSKLAKEMKANNIIIPSKPFLGMELLKEHYGYLSYVQFIHNEKLYLEIDLEYEIEPLEGFDEMKLSEFYALKESIYENKLNYIKI